MPPSSDQNQRPPGRDTARRGTTGTGTQTLRFVLEVDQAAPSVARERIGAWLRANHWSQAQVEDLVLAVNEAVSNSVEHGYRPRAGNTRNPSVEVDGRIVAEPNGARHVVLTVRDRGRWLVPAADSGTRGHGFRIMRACTQNMVVEHGEGGTTVVLRGRSVPAG